MNYFDIVEFVEDSFDCDYDYDYIADDISIHELDHFVNNITTAIDDSVEIVSSVYDKVRDSDFY